MPELSGRWGGKALHKRKEELAKAASGWPNKTLVDLRPFIREKIHEWTLRAVDEALLRKDRERAQAALDHVRQQIDVLEYILLPPEKEKP